MKPYIEAVRAQDLKVGDFMLVKCTHWDQERPASVLEEVVEVRHYHNSGTSLINNTMWSWTIPGLYKEPDHWCEECGISYEDACEPAVRYFDVLRFK